MQVKIYSPENFIYEFTENFVKNSDNIKNSFKEWVKNLIKLQNWKYLEIKESTFNPHWPEWDWTENTEEDKAAYKQAMIDLKNWNIWWSNSLEELRKTILW